MEEKFILETIGADPEVFIAKDGKIVPCIGVIGGTKNEGRVITDMLSVLEDNVCLEWNMTPSSTKEEFVSKSLEAITIIKSYVLPEEYEVVVKSLHEFSEDQLESNEAKEFGCAPDYNAYTRRLNVSPDPDTRFRAAGGHIHLGVSGLEPIDVLNAVLLCDALIGTYCVMNEEKTQRRKIYGAAGSFRPKQYGFEYRTPSNFWVESEEHMKNIYDLSTNVFSLLSSGITVENSDLNDLQRAINDHVPSLAKELNSKYLNHKKKTSGKKASSTASS